MTSKALLGFEKKIKHLDGHEVKISRDYVTQPGIIKKFYLWLGDVDKIVGEGMPQHEFSSSHGVIIKNFFENFRICLLSIELTSQLKLLQNKRNVSDTILTKF